MDLRASRIDISIKGKNGLGFLTSGAIIWVIITVIFLLPISVNEKSIYMLFPTGLMFPLSVRISHVIKADWKLEGNPLGPLGLCLNVSQLIYFPILMWAIGKNPEEAVIFFAIITVAHFFPYGWFYYSNGYTIMAPIGSLTIMIMGWNLGSESLWLVPLSMVILLFILVAWLYVDYKRKLTV